MESMSSILEKLNKEDTETLIIIHKNTKISSEGREHNEEVFPMSGMKELELKSTRFYKDKIELSPTNLVVPRKIYNQQGQFDYAGEEYTEDLNKKIGTNEKGIKWIYIGQFKKGTEILDGIGIMVYDDGHIYEGYWKDHKRNGYGRDIYPSGNFYIGNFKDGAKHGKGEFHWEDGRVYNGQFENDKRNGSGTLTKPDGTKKTGKWKNDKFQG